MKTLPESAVLTRLKKQAKHLLRDARAGQTPALRRFIETLPAAKGLDLAALARRELKLHDAQSVIARDHGFKSWTELKQAVAWRQADGGERLSTWFKWVYEGGARERERAARMLRAEPSLIAGDAWVACARGNEARLRDMLARDANWGGQSGGPLGMPPLVAVTHSGLILVDGFADPLLACAKLLIQQGADVNKPWIDPRYPGSPLSALYGAAGRTHHPGMTALLLQAGANPDDNESLYHSVESRDSTCTRLLLDAGARVIGTNAIGRVLDYDKLDILRLLLDRGGDATEQPWMHHAILRGRSIDHVRALVEAGADLRATNREGIGLYHWAQMFGRVDVVRLLDALGIEEPMTDEERFLAACTRGEEAEAHEILERWPDIVARLTPEQLQAMPRLAALGNLSAVKTMLAVGWPREVKTAWEATALNLAVFNGDPAMTTLLLENGADWRTLHGHGDNVIGTLSHASRTTDIEALGRQNFVACARALVEHGVSLAEVPRSAFSAEVADYLDSLEAEAPNEDPVQPVRA